MASSTDLVCHSSDSYCTTEISPHHDPAVPTIRAGLEAYRADMNTFRDQLVRVAQASIEASSQSTRAILAADNANREVIQSAHGLVGQAIESAEKTHAASITSNQQVSLAAMQIARQGTESMERVALNAQNITQEARKDERLLELSMQLADWRFVLKEAIEATVVEFARSKVDLLTQLMQNLADQKRREIEQEEEFNRKRLATSILHSRAEKINLANTFIKQSQSIFDDKQLYLKRLLSCVLIGCCISYCFGGQMATMTTITIGGAILLEEFYRTAPYYSDLSNRKKWLGVYLRALERLASEPKLNVRSAVCEILDTDLSIDSAQKTSKKTQEILSKIPNNPVTGDPDETIRAIPRELMFLVDHATRQAPRTFSHL